MSYFGEENLKQLKLEYSQIELNMDNSVEKFLIDAANDFVQNVINKSAKLKEMNRVNNSNGQTGR